MVAGAGLKAGFNLLVFKVVNETSVWKGSVRITDAAGEPVKGLRVTLTSTGAEIEAAENPQRKTP